MAGGLNAKQAIHSAADTGLVALARKGDEPAIRELIRRNNQRLFRVARAVLRNDAEAEDVVQETYVRAFTRLQTFEDRAAFSTWLTRIALNEAFARLRRRRRAARLDSELEAGMGLIIDFPYQRAAAADPERLAARAEIRRLLEEAIDELPDDFRLVFVLRCVEQLSGEETASLLGVPEETVKTRLHRAKARLRQALRQRLVGALEDAFPFAGARCERLCAAVLGRLGLAEPPPGPST